MTLTISCGVFMINDTGGYGKIDFGCIAVGARWVVAIGGGRAAELTDRLLLLITELLVSCAGNDGGRG